MLQCCQQSRWREAAQSRHLMQLTWADAGAPAAEEGKALTLVLTDVEGSTELWEWDHAAMMEAIQMHDCLMRAHLRRSAPLCSCSAHLPVRALPGMQEGGMLQPTQEGLCQPACCIAHAAGVFCHVGPARPGSQITGGCSLPMPSTPSAFACGIRQLAQPRLQYQTG